MPTDPPLRPCVFFDRDGIVNEEPLEGKRYITRVEEFYVIPAFWRSLEVVLSRGYRVVVVTNQKCISSGITPRERVEEIHRHLLALAEERGLRIDGIYYCPHGDDECECRKPKPGMLLVAAREHALDVGRSWMIGDRVRDCEAGRRAGCMRTVLVGHSPHGDWADVVLPGMDALPDYLAFELPTVS